MSPGREGSIPSLSIGLKNMRDPVLDSILNPPHEEIHTAECSWHRDWHACDCGTFEEMSARSSAEEQGPSKPKVAGSTPAGRDIQIAQLELARQVSLTLIRDCDETIKDSLSNTFRNHIEALES